MKSALRSVPRPARTPGRHRSLSLPGVAAAALLCACGFRDAPQPAIEAADGAARAGAAEVGAAEPSVEPPAQTRRAAVDGAAAEPPPPATTPPSRAAAPAAAAKKPAAAKSSGPARADFEAPSSASPAAPQRYRQGEDPEYARRMGWPVSLPEVLPGSILPAKRIVAYYGNPLSTRMGILGEVAPEEMLRRLDREVERWEKADPATPVQPALQLIAVVAQGEPGISGKYRTRMRDSLIEEVARWAESRDAIVILDVQVGTGTLQEELPRLREFLRRPRFHLAIDPEFSMKDGTAPGRRIGTMSAADVNYAARMLAELVDEYHLPPKVLVVHRFTRRMLTGSRQIRLDPRVQIVIDMDGWGAPWLKRASYHDYIVSEPVEFTGFKLFYHNDTRKGDPLLTPEQVLRLRPIPLYIQYQ